MTQLATAEAVGVSVRQLSAWEQIPAFRARLEEVRREMFSRVADSATDLGVTAVDALRDLLGPENPQSIRLGAARAVLDSAAKLREITTLAQRLADIEKALAGGQFVVAFNGQSAPLPWASAEPENVTDITALSYSSNAGDEPR